TYYDALNAGGGIDGWQVKLLTRDSKYDPQTQVQQFNGIADQCALIAESLGSPTTKAIHPKPDQRNLAIRAAAQDSTRTTDLVMVVIGTPYAIDDANALHYIVGRAKNPRIGIIYQNDEYGQDGLRGYTAGLNTYQFHSVARATYKATDTDLTAQVQKM